MAEAGFIRRHSKPLLAGVVICIITGGIFMLSMFSKSKEERRNREYEVSLVKALKNSYEGIEEIRITDPEYTSPPGSWSCDVEMVFKNQVSIKYGIGYDINSNEITDASLEWEKRIDDRKFLNHQKGKTSTDVKVIYSDSEEGEQ